MPWAPLGCTSASQTDTSGHAATQHAPPDKPAYANPEPKQSPWPPTPSNAHATKSSTSPYQMQSPTTSKTQYSSPAGAAPQYHATATADAKSKTYPSSKNRHGAP